MPIHDWARVPDGTWHDFYLAWIAELRNALNGGVLPEDYYAPAEQSLALSVPDILTLQTSNPPSDGQTTPAPEQRGAAAVAVAAVPPRMRLAAETVMDDYVQKRRTIVIRHVSGDRIVALLEIVSRGNKASRHALRSFVEKAVEALYRGYHLLIIDLFPPGPRDPNGIHGAIWAEVSDAPFALPRGEPLTPATYSAGPIKRAYIEPTAVGRELIDMPLFLEPELYVNVPLEPTYQAAYRGVPRRWREVLERPQGS